MKAIPAPSATPQAGTDPDMEIARQHEHDPARVLTTNGLTNYDATHFASCPIRTISRAPLVSTTTGLHPRYVERQARQQFLQGSRRRHLVQTNPIDFVYTSA